MRFCDDLVARPGLPWVVVSLVIIPTTDKTKREQALDALDFVTPRIALNIYAAFGTGAAFESVLDIPQGQTIRILL